MPQLEKLAIAPAITKYKQEIVAELIVVKLLRSIEEESI